MEQPVKNVIGERVREIRKAAKLSLNDLVARCGVAGLEISKVSLAMLESKKRGVSDFEVQVLAFALRVPLAALFPKEIHVPKRKLRNPTGPKPKPKTRPSKESRSRKSSRKKTPGLPKQRRKSRGI
jgi:transcriptional regulator with XRE-family HTH domain